MDDEELLAKAEEALTEIKVSQGLSDHHASVLAALRIRLKGSAGESLDELLSAAGDIGPDNRLDEEIEKAGPRRRESPHWTTCSRRRSRNPTGPLSNLGVPGASTAA